MPRETVWNIEPHTAAKHELLTRYLEAWFPIMTSWNSKVLFLDGFAGPGRYVGGEPGSPAIAVAAALKQPRVASNADVLFMFNENHKKRFAELEEWAEDFDSPAADKLHVTLRNTEFESLAQEIVDARGARALVPTFAFVDPFGFKGVPMSLVANLVRDKRSELFILFSYNSVNRWITHPDAKVTAHLAELFGTTDYNLAVGKSPSDRKRFLSDLYETQLRQVGAFAHVSRFEMIESNGRTSYFLYHCTRSLKGLEVMRSAMWKIDGATGCQFSDKVAGLIPLSVGPLALDLDQRLLAKFNGQRVGMDTIKRFLLTETPFAMEHLKKLTLKPMQQDGLIEVHNQKRRGTFPDVVEIEFPR